MKRFLIISLFVLNTLFLSAQTEGVSINPTGAEPDSSAMLDIQSSTKGLLIPRMNSSSRIAISNPAEGLMVYDSTTQSFWYYQQIWQELGENIPSEVRDTDGDTYVQVEATADEDNIRLGVKGGEAVTIDSAAVKVRADLLAGRAFEDGSSRIVSNEVADSVDFNNNLNPAWQSFTATANGKLDFIQLFILPTQQRNYTISLYEGEGTGGKLLSTTSIAVPAFSGWNQISFPTEVVLDKGTIYTVGFSSIRSIVYYINDAYSGGRSSENPDEDFRFRVNAFVESYGVSVVGGNVGIGTDTPTHALEVVGDVQISSLSGSDARMVVADSAGELTTQVLPDYGGIADADNDTYIQVEANSDEDVIRWIAEGKEAVNIDSAEMFVQTDFFAGRSFAASSSRIINYTNVSNFQSPFPQDSDWQSFTAPSGGKLDFIALLFGSNNPSPSYAISLYEGEGIGGRLLSSTNISSPNSLAWNQISFSDEIILRKGAIYTVGFSSRRAIGYEQGNLYPSGRSGSNPNWDYMLRVNVFTTSYALNFVDGRVGIGTDNPTRAQVEIAGSVNHQIATVLTSYGQTGPSLLPLGMPTPVPHSLYADGQIAANAFNAHSDARIKTIQGLSNSSEDLHTLMQIEITDYRMKDSLTKGNTPYKKVIAQQVAEVYPQAVTNTLTEVVPDIYQYAKVQDGWIMLTTDLQVGERVKVITESSSEVHEITAVEPDRFQVSSLTVERSEIPQSGKNCKLETVFIYGREVNDFHTVDYEAISMLNVSATQAQQRRIETLEAEMSALTQQLNAFQSLQTEQSRLAQELATLKAALHIQP